MDNYKRDQIVRQHGPLINRGVPSTTLNRVNIRHLNASARTPPHVSVGHNAFEASSPKSDESGPASPYDGQIANFSVVATGIYRSAFPFAMNLDHLEGLKLRTMITLVETPFDVGVVDYLSTSGIKHYRIPIPSHKEGRQIPGEDIAQVMRLLTNPCNHPVLLHCNKGKHRTGCMVASFRLLARHNDRSDWTHNTADPVSEYRTFSHPKSRPSDIAFINNFSPQSTLHAIAAINRPVRPIDYFPSPASIPSSSTTLFSASQDADFADLVSRGPSPPLPPSSPSQPPPPIAFWQRERKIKIAGHDDIPSSSRQQNPRSALHALTITPSAFITPDPLMPSGPYSPVSSSPSPRSPHELTVPHVPTALPPLVTPTSAIAGTDMGTCGNLDVRGLAYPDLWAGASRMAPLPTPPESVPESKRASGHEVERWVSEVERHEPTPGCQWGDEPK